MSNQWAASVLLLARACHLEPTLAVTALTGLLAADAGLGPGRGALVTAAVFTGQLTIGWSNDLIDERRDRAVGRLDKPLASDGVGRSVVLAALAVGLPLCVALSFLCGWRSALTHLCLGVASGWAYNVVLKRTVWSWLPYAVAFGALPAVVWLALASPRLPPGWLMAAAALLGVGAHIVNTLPDLADDARLGVRGLPHRLGARRSALLATCVLVVASVVTVLGPGRSVPVWAWVALAAVVALAVVALRVAGLAFRAVVAIAAVDIVVLLAR